MLLALERQGIGAPEPAKDVYIGYSAGQEAAAVNRATSLRSEGKVAELALAPQTKAEAEASRHAKGYATLVYLE